MHDKGAAGMTRAFDPYHRWLAILPEEQPPNHYRLLGIERFEEHPDVIQRAADRQMSYLRSFQTGAHGADSQRLLNEVAQAKLCLLNGEKKAAYDSDLRAQTKSPSLAMPDSRAWYYRTGADVVGPVSAPELRQQVAGGRVTPTTLIRFC